MLPRTHEYQGKTSAGMKSTESRSDYAILRRSGRLSSGFEECLHRVIPLGERHLRTLAESVAHYHGERNHQGLDNELIDRPPRQTVSGPVLRRERIGGLSYYCSAA